jgi:uncharacterized SAM-binding protein YcdF (DUF218 family)
LFFIFAKVLWFLLQPSSLIAGLFLAGTILVGGRWYKAGRRLLMAGIALLLVCGLSPLGDLLIMPLENRFPRPDLTRSTVAGIIILGGAEDNRTDPPRELSGLNEAGERYTEAVALSRRFPKAKVVFAGGSGALLKEEVPEAISAARLLEALGIAKDRIVLESKSRDTYENAQFTKAMVGPKPGERWLLITSGWHMPRAMGCFARAGFVVDAWPVDYRTAGYFDPTRFHNSISEGLRRLDLVMREYVGLTMYFLAGRTSALLPGPAS